MKGGFAECCVGRIGQSWPVAAARWQTAAEPRGALEERAEGGAGASMRNKYLESHRILLWSRAIYWWEGSSEFIFQTFGIKK